MDVRCPRCGEPFDIDEFHDVAKHDGTSFDVVRQEFAANGCMALGGGQCERNGSMAALASSVLFDMLGDDIDGVAADLEDFGFMGMLD